MNPFAALVSLFRPAKPKAQPAAAQAETVPRAGDIHIATPAAPKAIGRFPVLRLLGRGAQGSVYLARDPDLERLVAIKLVGRLPGQEEAGWPQARNLARLRHPHIVSLYEFGKQDDRAYLVCEYVEGATLAEELKAHGPMAADEAGKAMLQITDAVAHAHANGVLHLDLNPRNVMRDKEGNLRVMDFDVSRRTDAPAPGDLVVGTLPYMAPESVTAQRPDPRTDVYSLGQMFYTLLVGRPAIAAASREEMAARICGQDTDCAPLHPSDPGGRFAPLIRRAVSRDPAQRFADARAMHDALAAALAPASPADASGAVAFLLKRMERRGDFPALAKTLTEINRIAGDEKTTLARISAAVLRDYALTNRLLKLANSALYPQLAGKVSTVSDAIKMLGYDEVRLVASSLACLGHFAGGRQKRLHEESTTAFLAGLIARHLATRAGIKDVEQAFIAGLLLHLGTALALFYFPEDHWEIENLIKRGSTPDDAARKILGLTLPELGHAVAKIWGLPPAVIDCMIDASAGAEGPETRLLRHIARFANLLARVDAERDDSAALAAGAAALEPRLPPSDVAPLLAAGLDKLKAFAPALEIDLDKSACVLRLEKWLAANAVFRPSITP
ncbi:MAG TPA: HDOD domain-containing protein [Rhodocyclaceae bacterium]